MIVRSLLAFIALPGMVAFALPMLWQMSGPSLWPVVPMGLLLVALGTLGLLACAFRFYSDGQGTLAPWDPPQQLVCAGLFRYSRNPMYVTVVTILLGWALAYLSWFHLAYAGLIGVGFHLRVVLGEEPWLDQKYGDQWRCYAGQVPRWLFK